MKKPALALVAITAIILVGIGVAASRQAPAIPVIPDGRTLDVGGLHMQHTPDFEDYASMSASTRQSQMTYMDSCSPRNAWTDVICYTGRIVDGDPLDAAVIGIAYSTTTSQEMCEKSFTSNMGSTTETVVVGKNQFRKDTVEEAGLGHYVRTDSYRIFRNGACYTIGLSLETHRVDPGEKGGPSFGEDESSKEQSTLMQKMLLALQTVTFK